jgi:hypothetical protein
MIKCVFIFLCFHLNLLGFNLTEQTIANNESAVLFFHRLVESFKHAYSIRSEFGDEEFLNLTQVIIYLFLLLLLFFVFCFSNKLSKTPKLLIKFSLNSNLQIIKNIIDENYLNDIRNKIADHKTFAQSYYGKASSKLNENGTGI